MCRAITSLDHNFFLKILMVKGLSFWMYLLRMRLSLKILLMGQGWVQLFFKSDMFFTVLVSLDAPCMLTL